MKPKSRCEVIVPEQILGNLVECDPHLRVERYWGERSIFYNPKGAAPLGVIWVSLKDHDGENDRSADLDREGVYRLAFQLSRSEYERRFGPRPARPPKGGVVEIAGYEPTRLDELMPHPVYAWMAWGQVLSPSRAQFESLRPLMLEALVGVRVKWGRRQRT